MDAQAMSYEQRRALNIARNAERMRAIGLTTIDASALSPALPAQKQKRVPAPKSEIQQCADGTLSTESTLRRSGRLTGLPVPSYKDDTYDHSPPSHARVRATAFKSSAPRSPAPVAAGSSRGVNCDVQKLVDSYIGQAIAPRDGQVKRAVIALSCSGACPSFNRMSGITEWANCVFLFVNVGGTDYDNLLYFSPRSTPTVDDLVADDTGAACAVMTWFAQPRQDAATPVLQRLQSTDAHPVLVFFRVVGVPEYIFGGRLQYVAHDAAARPLQFWFRLVDWAALQASEGWAKVSKAGGMRAAS